MAVMHNGPGRHAQSHAECVHNSAGTHAQRPAVSMHFPGGVRSGSGLSVRQWCSDHKLSPQTYYRWQRRLFDMVKAQQEVQFADVTPERPSPVGDVAVTVRLSGAEADIHSGADAATVETVLRVLKSC